MTTELLTRSDNPQAPIRFNARGVTGAQGIEVEFARSTPAGAVASALADMLGMPPDTPWGLRDDNSSEYLTDAPIGDQIHTGASLSVSPRTHLGARSTNR